MSIRYTYVRPQPEHLRAAGINIAVYVSLMILSLFIYPGHPHFNIFRAAVFMQMLMMVISSCMVIFNERTHPGPVSPIDYIFPMLDPAPSFAPLISLGAWIAIIGVFVTTPDPFLMASFYGNTAKVESAIAKGVDVNMVEHDRGDTPLIHASARGHEDIVTLLLANNADITTKNELGQTAAWQAAENGHLGILKQLVASGADIHERFDVDYKSSSDTDLHGATLLWAASRGGHEDVVKYLLDSGAEIDILVNEQKTPLAIAAEEGHTDVILLLLEAGSDIEEGGKDGMTPLMRAVEAGQLEAVKALIAKGADVNAGSPGSYKNADLLLTAVENDENDIVEYLLQEKVGSAHSRSRALLRASERGCVDSVTSLLDAGVSPNVINENGETPLHRAVRYDRSEVVESLLAAGADVTIRSNAGVTPLQEARSDRNWHCARMIKRYMNENGIEE